jgi:hypothetical protein
MFLVAGGSFSLMPSSSGEMMIWHPRRDLIRPCDGGGGGALSLARGHAHATHSPRGQVVNLRFRETKGKVEHVLFLLDGRRQLVVVLLVQDDMARTAGKRGLARYTRS